LGRLGDSFRSGGCLNDFVVISLEAGVQKAANLLFIVNN